MRYSSRVRYLVVDSVNTEDYKVKKVTFKLKYNTLAIGINIIIYLDRTTIIKDVNVKHY